MTFDVFDTRDLIEWIDENKDLEDEEFLEVLEFANELEKYLPDFKYGTQVIREDYFVDEMKELMEDIGYIPRDIPSFIEIDWEATAENLKMDYTSFEFQGNTYYARQT